MSSSNFFNAVLLLLLSLSSLAANAQPGMDIERNAAVRGAVSKESIFPRQKKHVHSSTIVELSDGSLLAAWFYGSGERKADDVRVMGARKASDESEWSEPFLLADTPGHPDCNPVLWIDKEDRLWLFWSAILANEWESSLVKFRISENYLSASDPPVWQWQDTLHIKPVDLQNELMSNWPRMLESITFLPRAIESEFSSSSFFEFVQRKWKTLVGIVVALLGINIFTYLVHRSRSRRTGKAGWLRWAYRSIACYVVLTVVGFSIAVSYFYLMSNAKIDRRLGWLTGCQPLQLDSGEIILPLYSDLYVASIMAISNDKGVSWEASKPLVGFGNIQPSIIEKSDGTLFALMRENGVRKRIRSSSSINQGRDWSPVQETELPNPGSKVNAIALKSGNWVMAYNDLTDGRHSLRLAISTDEGASWNPSVKLEESLPDEGSFSYPYVLEASDGSIHVTYSSAIAEGEAIIHVHLDSSELQAAIPLAEGPSRQKSLPVAQNSELELK